MPQSVSDSGFPDIYPVPIYFEMPSTGMILSTFVDTTQEFERTLLGFESDLIKCGLQLRIIVLPPDAGSFRNNLGVVVIGIGTFWAFLESDTGKGFVFGLTGKLPNEIAEDVGEAVREKISSFDKLPSPPPEIVPLEKIVCGAILAESAKCFLELNTSELQEVGITPALLPQSFSAKNEFFHACEANGRIKSVSFHHDGRYPISRDEFQQRVAQVPPGSEQDDWEFSTVKFKVSSPNWERLDRKRLWKGKDDHGSTVFFSIIDPRFWKFSATGRLTRQHEDRIVAQAAFRRSGGKYVDIVLLNIIRFNDLKVSKYLDEVGLSARLFEKNKGKFGKSDVDLFNFPGEREDR